VGDIALRNKSILEVGQRVRFLATAWVSDAPEHVGKLTLLRVTEAPFLTTLMVWPPMVAEALVDVGDANVRTKAAEVAPPQAPVSGTVADTWVPDCVAVKVPLIQQQEPVLHWLVTW